MDDSRSRDFLQFASSTFGEIPNLTSRLYEFYESKIPPSDRADFFSLVVLELLEHKSQSGPGKDSTQLIKRVLERVKKRLYRSAIQQRLQTLPANIPARQPESSPQRIDTVEEIKSVLKNVNDVDATMFWLHLEEKTLDEIALLTNVTRSTAHRRISDVSKLVRERLTSYKEQ